MPDDLYNRDILIWSEQQADLLRRLAAGERMNEAVDWPNLIEEVQDVGLSRLNAVESFLRQAMIHLLKVYAFPHSLSSRKWGAEAANFLLEAQQRFSPSMRQRIPVERVYADAVKLLRTEYRDRLAPVPMTCPYTLDDLLADSRDVDALVAKLHEAAAARNA